MKYEYGIGDWEYLDGSGTTDVLLIIETKEGYADCLNYTGRTLIEAFNNAGQDGWYYCGKVEVDGSGYNEKMVFIKTL